MQIAFRVDGSHEIGLGHFMRCLTLATELQKRGASVTFVSNSLTIDLTARLAKAGIDYRPIVTDELSNEADDAQQTIEKLGVQSWDWVIVDHYQLGWEWESRLKKYTQRLMVVDDMATRRHSCDLLLDQNFSNLPREAYVALVPDNCRILLGVNYAMLQEDYLKLRELARPRESLKRIVVYFGGADQRNLTRIALEASLDCNLSELRIDVVCSLNAEANAGLHERCQKLENVTLHRAVPSMAPLLAAADLAIGASGASSWERCCLGLPAITCTLADNQMAIAKALDATNAIFHLGVSEALARNMITEKICRVAESGLLSFYSCNCFKICDANGTQRVANVIFEN